MSVNRRRPHVLVLPEDDANSQLANGFHLGLDQGLGQQLLARQFQVLNVAGGWTNVLEEFLSTHIAEMDRNSYRHMILLIDLDGKVDRLQNAIAQVPAHLTERVFILGALSEPEKLRPDLGDYETIGLALAKDCREGTNTTWGHRLLQHNTAELDRLRSTVRPILFPSGA
ncbi:MAG: hypothetical protein ABSH56_27100 [Bryobacteraceae bacterium]|jgi:hypothetical protein